MGKNIIILGPPCSGKGTASKKIAKQYDLVHVSTGDIIREEIKNGTDFGKTAEILINKGDFIPDERMIPKLKEFLIKHKNANGYVFDGFPRNINQAKMLDKIMFERKLRIDHVFLLNCDTITLVKRMRNRMIVEGREDDKDSVFVERINNYSQQTKPVNSYYKSIVSIDSKGTPEEVHEILIEKIG